MEENQLDASQLKDYTYSSPNIKDFTLDDNLPELKVPANGHIFKSPKTRLGALDALPLEILHMVLASLDLSALVRFRRVNQRAMEVVESIPQYKAITTHARSALRGILIVGRGSFISCDTLYEALCTAECEECGDFGGYLYILTCKRICFLCFTEDTQYLPLAFSQAVRNFGINRRIFDSLPSIKSIPGTYSPNKRKYKKQSILVDFESAYLAGVAHHGSVSAMEEYVFEVASKKGGNYNDRLSTAEGQSVNPTRFMAVVRAPWLSRTSRNPEWGLHCIGCEKRKRCRPLYWRIKYSVASFSEHLRDYGTILQRQHYQV